MIEASELAKATPQTPEAPVFIRREHRPLPRNLTGRVLPMVENRFADAWLPLRPQVLDHWQNRDGSQQNKIRLPNGKVICGRQAANELLEPLVNPIWMYQGC